MTFEEARKIFDDELSKGNMHSALAVEEAMKVAVSALSKCIAKDSVKSYACPICNAALYQGQQICKECGQEIRWYEEG